jgi:hypothetical protein
MWQYWLTSVQHKTYFTWSSNKIFIWNRWRKKIFRRREDHMKVDFRVEWWQWRLLSSKLLLRFICLIFYPEVGDRIFLRSVYENTGRRITAVTTTCLMQNVYGLISVAAGMFTFCVWLNMSPSSLTSMYFFELCIWLYDVFSLQIAYYISDTDTVYRSDICMASSRLRSCGL